MTEAEIVRPGGISDLLTGSYGIRFDDARIFAWREATGDLTETEVFMAVRAWIQGDHDRPPAPGQIRTMVVDRRKRESHANATPDTTPRGFIPDEVLIEAVELVKDWRKHTPVACVSQGRDCGIIKCKYANRCPRIVQAVRMASPAFVCPYQVAWEFVLSEEYNTAPAVAGRADIDG